MTLANRCTRCKKRLNQQVVRLKGMQFHAACFYCDACKKPIQKTYHLKRERIYDPACYEAMFLSKCESCQKAITGKYYTEGKARFHEACYQKIHHLSCCICEQNIEGPYFTDHWGNKAHAKHGNKDTEHCHVCARILSDKGSSGGITLNDGRVLCGICDQTRLKDPMVIRKAKLEVIEQMKQVGFDYIPDYIRAQVSDDQALLNERLRASPTGNIHGYTRTAQRNIPNYGLILEHSIFIISGLPRLVFMSVLAHELLHVWIHENKLDHLSPPEVEGFCNLGSALMYHNSKDPLSQVMLKRMDEDPDPVYGDGYRLMSQYLDKLGWPELLKALLSKSPLPDLGSVVNSAAPAPPVTKPIVTSAPADQTELNSDKKEVAPPAKRKYEPGANKKLDELKARLNKTISKSRPKPSKGGLNKKSKLKKLGKRGKHKD